MKTNRYSQNPPMFRNNPFSFIISILLIFVFGLGILIFLIWYLKCKSTKIIVSNDELEFEKGLLSKERIEIKLNMIRSVKVNQSFFQRIFGVGDLEIYSSGDEPEIVVAGMPNPLHLKELLKFKNL